MSAWPWLVAPAVILACVWLARRRHRLQNRYLRRRTLEHEVYVTALEEWAAVPEIVEAGKRAGVCTDAGLERLSHQLYGDRPEAEIEALIMAFLQDRSVRQAIAKHMSKEHGSEKKSAMRELMAIADMARG